MTILEVCIDSVASAIAAEKGGANRLEVCNSLAVGGTTPSHGLMRACAESTSLPLMMMIRPHDGGFVYSEDDIKTMLHDIAAANELGAHGVVFGALTPTQEIDVPTTERLIAAARPLDVTFHRAFDVCVNAVTAMEQLLQLNVDRLLTSGQSATAEQGGDAIRSLVEKADGQMAILAGAGINAANVVAVVDQTGVQEVHASCSHSVAVAVAHGEVAFGVGRRETSAEIVRELVMALNR